MTIDGIVLTDRQRRIQNWDQDAISNLNVSIVGGGPLAQRVIAALTGLSVGSVTVFDNTLTAHNHPYEFMENAFDLHENYTHASGLEVALRRMNSLIKPAGMDSGFSPALMQSNSVLVDLTNDPYSKAECVRYARNHNIKFVSASTNILSGRAITLRQRKKLDDVLSAAISENKYLMTDYAGAQQGGFTSAVIAGVVVDEIRKFASKLGPDDTPLANEVNYNVRSSERFEQASDITIADKVHYKSPGKILVAGGGALGNFVLLELALRNPESITILEPDKVDATNRNRQILFSMDDCVGKYKADFLQRILTRINPGMQGRITGVRAALGDPEDFPDDWKDMTAIGDVTKGRQMSFADFNQRYGKFDLIFSCFDNFTARYALNNFAMQYDIPIINGASSPQQSQVNVFVPGKTACLDCSIGLKHGMKAEKEKQLMHSASCIANDHEPSVVYTNMIAAGMMVGEMETIFNPGMFGEPIQRQLEYYSLNNNDRMTPKFLKERGANIRGSNCQCSKITYAKR